MLSKCQRTPVSAHFQELFAIFHTLWYTGVTLKRVCQTAASVQLWILWSGKEETFWTVEEEKVQTRPPRISALLFFLGLCLFLKSHPNTPERNPERWAVSLCLDKYILLSVWLHLRLFLKISRVFDSVLFPLPVPYINPVCQAGFQREGWANPHERRTCWLDLDNRLGRFSKQCGKHRCTHTRPHPSMECPLWMLRHESVSLVNNPAVKCTITSWLLTVWLWRYSLYIKC